MPIDLAERIYTLIGAGVIAAAFIAVVVMHRSFHDPALESEPESLSDSRLRRILSWGKTIHRINAGTPKADAIERRMQLAMEELRRRRAPG
jgi:hypothetical protein